MVRKRGERLKPSRKRAGERSLLVDALVVGGVAASVGLIAVSVALNFRMGFRSADNPLDGALYGTGSALGDCLKAIAPFMLAWGVKQRDVLASAAAAGLFLICSTFSFVASFGFAAEHRAAKAGVAQSEIDGYGDLRGEKARIERRISFLGPQRSPLEVERAVEAVFSERAWGGGPTVGAVSKECAEDRKSTRTRCGRVALLRAELVRAQEAEKLSADLQRLHGRFEQREGRLVVVADAQVDALSRAAALVSDAVTEKHIGLWLSLLLASFLEIGSGLGLYMVTTPWRARSNCSEVAASSKLTPSKILGHVDAYMLARVQRGEGMLSVQALHEDYLRWCAMQSRVPYVRAEFEKRFATLAQEVGLVVTFRAQKPYYTNLLLAGA